MSQHPIPPLLPVQRLYAEGRILAGLLTEGTASSLPEFVRAPLSSQNSVRARFGVPIADRNVPLPQFRHIDEPAAIDILAKVAAACGGPLSLGNLVGFEWVDIAGITAGSYVAAPMPVQGRVPTIAASSGEVATFCLLGSPLSAQDLSVTPTSENLLVVSPERLRPHPILHPNLGPQGGLVVEYLLAREPSPINVFLVNDRIVALNHQERLVALMEAGIKEALCLVHYGYGTETLKFLSSLDTTFIDSDGPPRVSDFCDEEIMVRIPVQTPRTLVTLSQHTIDLAVIE